MLDAVILGVVEGLTEFLPISSTAHLILTSRLLAIPESGFLASFVIVIQLGAISCVVLLFGRTIVWDLETMKRVAVAFVPTAVIGFALYSVLKAYLLESLGLIAWTLLIGGIILVVFEYWHRGREDAVHTTPLAQLPYMKAFLIGCAQAIAIVPGVSRAGATILGGLALGMGRKEIVEFSVLLAVPTMLAATGYDLLKAGPSFSIDEWQLAIGFLVSFIAAYAAIRVFIRFVQTHTFSAFGWYRIVLGIVLLAFLV